MRDWHSWRGPDSAPWQNREDARRAGTEDHNPLGKEQGFLDPDELCRTVSFRGFSESRRMSGNGGQGNSCDCETQSDPQKTAAGCNSAAVLD
jgi:hypothetical protein